MPTIFITGASSGIGKATAKYFAGNGWEVIATMRRPENEHELANLQNVRLMPLDVTNSAQIINTCQNALAEHDVDVLFNNAGYGIMAPFEMIDEATVRKLFDTDVIGCGNAAIYSAFQETQGWLNFGNNLTGRYNRAAQGWRIRSGQTCPTGHAGIPLL